MHLQSPLLLSLELDRIDRNLLCWMKTDLFVIWSEDDPEKSIRCSVVGLLLIRFPQRRKICPSFIRRYHAKFSQLAWCEGL